MPARSYLASEVTSDAISYIAAARVSVRIDFSSDGFLIGGRQVVSTQTSARDVLVGRFGIVSARVGGNFAALIFSGVTRRTDLA